ncbi:hypothetical protein [Coleofasciculus sp. G2-EDA-02]|uniref:hypothetical protein n=1 Tax=Coleofasciculus sp. G2-EDA-02 TaxID=3069529 RepID=UPI003303C837
MTKDWENGWHLGEDGGVISYQLSVISSEIILSVCNAYCLSVSNSLFESLTLSIFSLGIVVFIVLHYQGSLAQAKIREYCQSSNRYLSRKVMLVREARVT